MNATNKVDLMVIGAGPGGYVAAIRAAQLGMSVLCVERNKTLGGTCLNVGCIPSKALLYSSQKYAEARHGWSDFGIETKSLSLNLPKMMERKEKIVEQLTNGIAFLFQKNKVKHLVGHAKLLSSQSVSIKTEKGEEAWEADHILIATGSEPSSLPNLPIDEKKIISSTGALNLEKVPQKMIVVGGGYIGLELGSVWQRLGTEVTVVEYMDKIVPQMDREVGEALYKSLLKQGLTFKLSTEVLSFKDKKEGVSVEVRSSSGNQETLDTDIVLVATGRKPLTQDLGLKDLGIVMNERGFIVVNEKYETSVSGVYAIGDVIPGPMLAHKAEEEGIAAVENMASQYGHVNYGALPAVIYTHPEVASVGKTEEELEASSIPYKVGKFPFQANSRAKTMGDTDGFVKVLSHSSTDKVLGVHIIGPEAGTLIAESVLAIEFSASSEDIARTCHAHPTLNEAVKEAALAIENRSIHK